MVLDITSIKFSWQGEKLQAVYAQIPRNKAEWR